METKLGYEDAWIALRGFLKIWLAQAEKAWARANNQQEKLIAETRCSTYLAVLGHMMWQEGCLDSEEKKEV